MRSSRALAVASLGMGLTIGLGLRVWVVEPFTVSSDSMEPAVMRGSTVLLSRLGHPGRAAGDLVVFESPLDGRQTLKRVVAVEGEVLTIRDGVVVVDGEPIPEDYVDPDTVDGTFFRTVRVPEGHVFVLGDNRAASIDSRDFGAVPVDDIDATVLWPRGAGGRD